ncbi:phosphatidylinositol 4-phosphate 5-kinase-like [Ruditapes philippinarum]|uniref:phosphatidylinositol 4-phosphate 5-kinase-like n=1 Tax=Ruditapes philippinarum TaxID=129788 RepID=UPI00295A85B7|nr:phosphatidylinositol 4-phosphate 5-kinase-like [Ruditapes philippinarum]
MFRKYFEDQGMSDSRDSWYKPNMLYNIHYRPSKPKDPPKFKVITKLFNPSICTCGDHGCEPHYRMEREVVWLEKEVDSKTGRDMQEVDKMVVMAASSNSNINEITKKLEICEDDNNEEKSNGEDNDDDEDDDNDDDSYDGGDNNNVAAADDDDNDDDDGDDDDDNNAAAASDDEYDTGDVSEIGATDDKEVLISSDEEYGSAFGILMVYCNSEIHSTWDVKECNSY